ncbi:hypothetical protein Taro_046320 [Colocasia esculenta]|uniref:Uncharacterized protein n=1 Tax=Colocasia esculenta TaxID=4460 RepID=A0A843WS05_COLES|nr:hypothetical protein [Colocasia esculenta]
MHRDNGHFHVRISKDDINIKEVERGIISLTHSLVFAPFGCEGRPGVVSRVLFPSVVKEDLVGYPGCCSFREKRMREIVLKPMGQAINKTVAIAEVIKVPSSGGVGGDEHEDEDS